MQFPNPQQLAAHLDHVQEERDLEGASFDLVAFDKKYRQEVCCGASVDSSEVEVVRPCTSIQAGIIAQYLRSEGAHYNTRFDFVLNDDIDLERLRGAWTEGMRKHEMLRTGFANIRHEHHPFVMITYKRDAKTVPWKLVHEKGEGAVLNSFQIPTFKVDPESLHVPPWRLQLRLDQEKPLLQLNALHALYDASSLELILADVARSYGGITLTPAVPLDPVLRLILSNSGNVSKSREAFWRAVGEEMNVVKFPCLTPRVVGSGKEIVVTKRCSLSFAQLEEQCVRHGIAFHAAGQVAWARLLSAYTGAESVTFGVVLSGRLISLEAEEAVFPCVTTVPMTCRLAGTNEQLLKKNMHDNRKMIEHQFTPLANVQRWIGHAGEALFDTLFAFQKLSQSDTGLPPLWKTAEIAAQVDVGALATKHLQPN